MTTTAIGAGDDVIRWFTSSRHAVVTVGATASDLCVINLGSRIPCRGGMTVLAEIG